MDDLIQESSDQLNSDPIDFLTTPPKKRTKIQKHRRASFPIIDLVDDEREDFDPIFRAPPPIRSKDGTLHFDKKPQFTPNLTPSEMLRLGSFGGTAFK